MSQSIVVVVPCFRVKSQIMEVLGDVGPDIDKIIVVDDFCPEQTGLYVTSNVRDSRVSVIFHRSNMGVGGAVISGYREAIKSGAEIVVKLDGDGQMNPTLISDLIEPILSNRADYTKGNRFFNAESIRQMPKVRLIGNLALSFFAKLSTGYWHLFDPNNGFTAIRVTTLKRLEFDKIDKRYFFESDILFRLNLVGARVEDVYMDAVYGNEKSNLRLGRVLWEFPIKHFRNLIKRIMYTYYLRDLSLASLELPIGILLFSLGAFTGLNTWFHSISSGEPSKTGTLVLFATSILAGLQLILSFLAFDIDRTNRRN